MKKSNEKHIAGWITTALIIIVAVLSFPFAWFKIEADEFLQHSFYPDRDIMVRIEAYKTDTEVELETSRDKNTVLLAIQREARYTGPLWYRTPFRTVGEDEIYCIRVNDFSEAGGSWGIYISNNPLYSFLDCSDVFGAKLIASNELLEILREYTTV